MASYPALDVSGADPELLLALVDDFAPTAVDTQASRVTVFFSNPENRDAAQLAIRRLYPEAIVTSREVDDEDWARRSQQNLRPVTVGRIIVAPPWSIPQPPAPSLQPPTPSLQPPAPSLQPPAPSLQPLPSLQPPAPSLQLVIAPSMGFGTGHHATTRLCLAALQAIDLHGMFVLDVGTGSGVLAMAARLLGAGAALGIDSDADAIQSAEENLALNPLLEGVAFEVADLAIFLRSPEREPADVVTANLTGALLIRSAGLLTAAVRQGGCLILSGILRSELKAVQAAFAARTLAASVTSEQEWAGLTLTRVD